MEQELRTKRDNSATRRIERSELLDLDPIYELEYKDGEFHIRREYETVLHALELLGITKSRANIDQAIRKGYRAFGKYWTKKSMWDAGKRPSTDIQKRNIPIYLYDEDHKFIDRFRNVVDAANQVELAVSCSRLAAKGEKPAICWYRNRKGILVEMNDAQHFHKGYWFYFQPLDIEDDFMADIKEKLGDIIYIDQIGFGSLMEIQIYPTFFGKVFLIKDRIDFIVNDPYEIDLEKKE